MKWGWLLLFIWETTLSLYLPQVELLDSDGTPYTTLAYDDAFLKKHHMQDFVTSMDTEVIEPQEDLLHYRESAIRMGFDPRSLRQINQTYYDHKVRDFLSSTPEHYIEGEEIGKDEKTEEDTKVMEGLDKT